MRGRSSSVQPENGDCKTGVSFSSFSRLSVETAVLGEKVTGDQDEAGFRLSYNRHTRAFVYKNHS
jgi:hypothetical protein